MGLQEKVKKGEKRLNTIEELLSKNKKSEGEVGGIDNILNDDKESIFRYKQLEELINTNKDALTKIEVDLKQVAEELKSSSGENDLKDKRRCKFWNAGYCKLRNFCTFLHPEIICKETKCVDKFCKKRHPRTCKNWKKGSCKFSDFCEFIHEERVDFELNKNLPEKETNQDDRITEKLNEDSEFIDYDNIDSDDDEINDNMNSVKPTFSCDRCDYTSHVKSTFTRHVKTSHENACNECDFETTNKMHLKMHVKACHKKNLHNTKKRKSTDEISSSSSKKNKKNNVISKKVKKVVLKRLFN